MAFVYPTLEVSARISDGYADTIIARSGLVGYWRLGESVGPSAVDASGNGHTGTYVNSPTLGVAGAIADGDTAVTFDGTNDYIDVTMPAMTQGTLECWAYSTSIATDQIIISADAAAAPGRDYLRIVSSKAYVSFDVSGTQRDFIGTTTLLANTWYHIAATYDGANVRLYVNGVQEGALAAAGSLTWSASTPVNIGRYRNTTDHYFPGRLDEVAIYSRALTAAEFLESIALASTDGWLDLDGDTLAQGGVTIKYGIDGNGPTNCVASTGQLQCVLNNSEYNDALTQGYYSPSHASARAGWTFGIPVSAVFTYSAVEYEKFTGKIRDILPFAGKYRSRQAQVTAYDCMRDLAEADAREVAIQTNKAEDELLDTLIAAMPEMARPIATAFDAGVDTYPYVFDKVAGQTKVLSVMRDIVVSSLGMLFPTGNGTLTYKSRHALATSTSAGSLTDSHLDDVSVPSSLDGVFNRVRVTTHPKVVSATATDALYTLPTGASVEIGTGETVDVWTDYTDPNDRQVKVGGTEVVTVLVGGTHYAANSQADGLGSNMTADIAATLTPFASTAKWSFTNSAASPAFITTQTVIGKAVRDPGPRTLEAYEAQDYGDRPINIDLPYQDDPYIGQSAADYIVAQYSSLSQQIESVVFLANRSATMMTHALSREPGDRITITEPVTGLSSVECIIQSVELEVKPGLIVICKWGVRPANTTRFWQWGIAGASEWGSTTTYAF